MASTKTISLGLQGGGTYGAFTWGVLDRLLQEEDIHIEGISGTSAGAINAVLLASGHASGGREGARAALNAFWNALGQAALLGPVQRTPMDYLAGGWTVEYSPLYQWLQLAGATAAPVLSGPVSINPLRNLLLTLVDFERVRASAMRLFVTATNVNTGKAKIFTRDELEIERVMASACLPQVFGAVFVDGEPYWDGSFVGNPALSPLLDGAEARDILIVQNNPIARAELPLSVADINNRANEISFNIAFVREVSALQHISGLVDEERGEQLKYAVARLHMVSGTEALSKFRIASKFNSEPGFLHTLHGMGVEAAGRWLASHREDIGLRSTLDPVPVYFAEQQ